MKKGYLSSYFKGVAAKTLSAVEVDPDSSNQREFNGSKKLIALLGHAGTEKKFLPARMIYLQDEEQPLASDATVTWYDARAKNPDRTEHRLYFPPTDVSRRAKEGDVLFIARHASDSLLLVIAAAESTAAAQLCWLFGIDDLMPEFQLREGEDIDKEQIGIAAAFILEQIGIEPDLSDENYLEQMLEKFEGRLPPTRDFSEYARSTIADIESMDAPDDALVKWMEREEVLFRTLEKHLIGERLKVGFMSDTGPDVDSFLTYSLSVLNRRKSRAGAALENHLEYLFGVHKLRFERGARTELNNRPDFLFPGAMEYARHDFPQTSLTMLAAKTTAKDRWRQVTKEADRISPKHLLTLEPAISERQTKQMQESKICLVVPRPVQVHYTARQRSSLLDVAAFIELVRSRDVREIPS